MDAMEMQRLLDGAKDAKPVAEFDGLKAYTFEDYVNVTSVEQMNNTELGLTKFNPDGSPAKTPTKYVAVNVENFFINRYRQVKKTIQVVIDYWCITEQVNGKIPLKQIPCYVISRNEDGKLQLDKIITVSDEEFLSSFKNSLDRESMEQILPLLKEAPAITKDKLAI